MKCPNDCQCLICVGTTCTCGDCKDAHKPCAEQRKRFTDANKTKK
ncbi:hypothetical protein [Desulfotomaculum defluvii]